MSTEDLKNEAQKAAKNLASDLEYLDSHYISDNFNKSYVSGILKFFANGNTENLNDERFFNALKSIIGEVNTYHKQIDGYKNSVKVQGEIWYARHGNNDGKVKGINAAVTKLFEHGAFAGPVKEIDPELVKGYFTGQRVVENRGGKPGTFKQ